MKLTFPALVIPLVLWAVTFEVVLPATTVWTGRAFADPCDVLCYAAGGLASLWFWTWWYAAPKAGYSPAI